MDIFVWQRSFDARYMTATDEKKEEEEAATAEVEGRKERKKTSWNQLVEENKPRVKEWIDRSLNVVCMLKTIGNVLSDPSVVS